MAIYIPQINKPPRTLAEIEENLNLMAQGEPYYSRRPQRTGLPFRPQYSGTLTSNPYSVQESMRRDEFNKKFSITSIAGIDLDNAGNGVVRMGVFNRNVNKSPLHYDLDDGDEYGATAILIAVATGAKPVLAEGIVQQDPDGRRENYLTVIEATENPFDFPYNEWVYIPHGTAHNEPEPDEEQRIFGRVFLEDVPYDFGITAPLAA